MKKILLLAISSSIFYLAHAQTYDTTTYYGKMAYTFNNLGKTQITTGLLQDYGTNLTGFN
ncbi:MAG: hypothetical protein JSU03_02960 [Bacteroidetes bacterium]|nr:hypothetical protein [Bacteroidota bacterium]